MLVPMRAILEAADTYRYGQAAFNMNSFGQVEAAVRIHELMHSGAILQGAEASNAYMGGEIEKDYYYGMLQQREQEVNTEFYEESRKRVQYAFYIGGKAYGCGSADGVKAD